MRHPKLCAPLLADALLLGGTAACSEDPAAEQELDLDDQEITPGFDPGEEPVLDGEDP